MSGLTLAAVVWIDRQSGAVRPPVEVTRHLDQLAVTAGFEIIQVSLRGHRFTPDSDILGALQLTQPMSLIGFDAQAAEARIAKLSWIEAARITWQLPEGLLVNVAERQPFAVWQRGERYSLIDRTGAVLASVRPDTAPGLLLIAGRGAPGLAARLHAEIAGFPEISERLGLAIRVGERRWTLRLRSGVEIHLPAVHHVEALARIVALHRQHGLLDKEIAAIDARLPRLFVEVRRKNQVPAKEAADVAPVNVNVSANPVL